MVKRRGRGKYSEDIKHARNKIYSPAKVKKEKSAKARHRPL